MSRPPLEAGLAGSAEGPTGAPALVLLHSLGTDRELWRPQIDRLRSRFRILCPELPGHGQSGASPGPISVPQLAQEVTSLLDRLEIERASLCGISIGGMVAMELAASHPERVERLVLAATGTRLGTPESWRERANLVRSGGLEGLTSSILGRWFGADFRRREPELVEGFGRQLGLVDEGSYAALCELLADTDLGDRVGEIRAPTLLIFGAEDQVATPEMGIQLQRSIAGSALVVLPGASHLNNVERGPEFSQLLQRHLLGDTLERGLEARRQVLGAEHVDRAEERTTAFDADFQELLTRYAWGEVWSRPQLGRKTRRLVTLTALVALGRWEEFEMHLGAALGDDLGEEEISELLLQLALYCGLPAANTAFEHARHVLARRAGSS